MEEGINTVLDLVQRVRDSRTGGYEVDFEILPNREAHKGFLVIDVKDTEPGSHINGQWWFDADGFVMQVL